MLSSSVTVLTSYFRRAGWALVVSSSPWPVPVDLLPGQTAAMAGHLTSDPVTVGGNQCTPQERWAQPENVRTSGAGFWPRMRISQR